MSKKLITFSTPQKNFAKNKPLDFVKVDKGFEVDMMIFSTANNRNKVYFQVSDLLKWQGKEKSLLFNFNHDLSLSEGKYLSNKNEFTKIWSEVNGGEFEIWARFRTTDKEVIAKKDEITQPSIELMVDEETAIISEKGEYYDSVDYQGTALLLGVPAGSGQTRIGETKSFDLDKEKENNQKDNTMADITTEQAKEFFATDEGKKFKATLLAEDKAKQEDDEKTKEAKKQEFEADVKALFVKFQAEEKEKEEEEKGEDKDGEDKGEEGEEKSTAEKQVDNALDQSKLDKAKKSFNAEGKFSTFEKVSGDAEQSTDDIKLTNPLNN